MLKQTGTSVSAKALRNTKTGQAWKQTPPLKSKVMLTDLCPEQKAKIGELVRTLESRKKQNQHLLERLKEAQVYRLEYQEELEKLKKENIKYQQQQTILKKELHSIQEEVQAKEKQIKNLSNQVASKAKLTPTLVEQFSMTDTIRYLDQGSQVTQKRKKTKQIGTQAFIEKEKIKQDKNIRSKSRSVQKIKKSTHSHKNDRSCQQNKGRLQTLSIQDVNSYDQYQNEEEEQTDEDFDELAKKWLELKEKNVSKIKESLSLSKRDRNTDRQRHDKIKAQFEALAEIVNHKENTDEANLIQSHEHLERRPRTYRPEEDNFFEAPKSEFDEEQLNKILKTKSFSASRLMRKNRLNTEETPNKQPRIPSTKNNRNESNHSGNHLKQSGMSSSPKFGFYQTNLLDIVNSIKP